MNLFAAQPGIPIFGLALTAPTIVILVGGAFYFAKNRGQRMANLVCGFIGAVTSIFSIFLLYDPVPNSWGDENHGFIVFAMAPIGAALGLALSLVFRGASSAQLTHEAARPILAQPLQPGMTRTCPKCLTWFSLQFVASRTDSVVGTISTYRCTKCDAEVDFASHHPANAI